MFNLNETGALILQALQDGKDVTEIIDLLLAEYDINIQDAEKEVNTFVDTLKNNSLIL